MNNSIALVGMACRYPDADNPKALWENVLAKRRAFRRLPAERLNLADYFSENPATPDAIYCNQAAVIEGYEFDRVKYRVAGSTYRSTDLTHWLALDVATQALEDAGFPHGSGLSKERTGVLVGNTLTGEFSRAALMRLRWPFVRRMVDAELQKQGWDTERRKTFLIDLEANYKKPFAPVGEETLAGGLSNTIAGRICNYFDFMGGGYTLDGACSSSLVAVANACSALLVGDVDVVLAGGVDLSLDPFELVGFSKNGAFATGEMRVYDAAPNGFLPGEGCGFVVLMRYDDALAYGARCYGLIRGWGISSDGNGGLTRPEVKGQRLALERAYQRAGYGIDTVPLFEGHGTGTAIGDEVELRALISARHQMNLGLRPAAIGSVKANIGHTKAAAGLAGLLKATMAVHNQILPPTTGFKQPNPLLTEENVSLRLLSKGEAWPDGQPLRAGVSSFGFGGINVHLAIENINKIHRTKITSREQLLLATPPDYELFLLSADDVPSLLALLQQLLQIAPRLSLGELTDLAATLARQRSEENLVKAALLAATPAQLTDRLEYLATKITAGKTQLFAIKERIFFKSVPSTNCRITLLFPGQASPVRLNGGIWEQHFSPVQELYERAAITKLKDPNSTAVAQPTIITAELAGLQTLAAFGIQGQLALGHSLGEFAALHWAGAMDEATLLNMVKVRGRAMSDSSSTPGAMLSLAVDGEKANTLCANLEDVNIAGFNGPKQTIISGKVTAIEQLKQRVQAQGIKATRLPVSSGFHSKLMIPAAEVLEAHLAQATLQPLQRRVISTISGAELEPAVDLRLLLKKQMTHPVRFTDALAIAKQETDLFIEIGPGQILTELVRQVSDIPVVALDVAGTSLQGLLSAIGAAYVVGAPIKREKLFADRFTRPFSLDWQPKFFVNPCELAPQLETGEILETSPILDSPVETAEVLETPEFLDTKELNVLERLRHLVAKHAEFPPDAIYNHSRLLADLHLNSISVGQIVAEVGHQIGLHAPVDPTVYANATLEQVASAMDERIASGEVGVEPVPTFPAGVDAWVRAFSVELVEQPLRGKQFAPKGHGGWLVFGDSAQPLIAPLEKSLNEWGGGGVALCLLEEVNENQIGIMLEAAKVVLDTERHYFVLVQYNKVATAFARTLHREYPDIITCVITVSSQNGGFRCRSTHPTKNQNGGFRCRSTHPTKNHLNQNGGTKNHLKVVENILAEVQIAHDYHEVYYDVEGVRGERVLKLLPTVAKGQTLPLTKNDVLLVSGGGKGITAECAAALARDSGVRLVLVGRANSETDLELSDNLTRFQKMGINFKYWQTDVTDAEAVKATVAEIVREWGPITALLHGAGINQPASLRNLNEVDFQQTLAPKVGGLRHLLAAIVPEHLRLLISFGSIIATTGMPGEAHYALANEWLAEMTANFHTNYPSCRCLTLEWSVWSDVGMGRRLGSDEILAQQGITPISPDVGVAVLRQALLANDWPSTVVVTGRMPDVPTLRLERPDMPFFRFLEQPRVYYPGIELIVDTELSLISDPHLNDHIYDGQRLFAAVMGLEAMAQVAAATLGVDTIPVFEEVRFSRPVVVEETKTEMLQIAALVQSDGSVDVALRCAQTGFKVDHFRARCRFLMVPEDSEKAENIQHIDIQEKDIVGENVDIKITAENIDINPQRDLYGSLLFQEGRFKRLHAYRHIEATQCIGEIAVDDSIKWFGRYLSPTLMLGDPGSRDATIHAIQVCTPHAQLLPIGINKLKFVNVNIPGPLTVFAKERWHEDDLYCYDLTVRGANGELREIWDGLRLRQVSPITWPDGWVEPLLASYIERRLQELIPKISLRVIMHREATERESRSDHAIKILLGENAELVRRPDGKPEVPNSEMNVSAANAGDLTLAIAGSMSVACDLEPVVKRDEQVWADLLGMHQDLMAVISKDEDRDRAATRIWTVRECLKKIGALLDTPLTLKSREADGWILLGAGNMIIASSVIAVKTNDKPLALAVLIGDEA